MLKRIKKELISTYNFIFYRREILFINHNLYQLELTCSYSTGIQYKRNNKSIKT